MDREISFWLAVGLVSVASVALAKVIGAQRVVQENVPAVSRLAASL